MKTKKRLKKEDIKRSDGIQVRSVIHRMKMREAELTLISVSGIVFIIIVTFLIFSSSVQKHENYSMVEIGDLEVVFSENKNNIDDIIYLDRKNILSDKEGLDSRGYTFDVQNNSKRVDSYVIKIINDYDMIEADQCANKVIDSNYIKYSIDGSVPVRLGDSEKEVIFRGKLDKNKKTSHDVKIWIDDHYLLEDDFHYHGKIVVEEK